MAQTVVVPLLSCAAHSCTTLRHVRSMLCILHTQSFIQSRSYGLDTVAALTIPSRVVAWPTWPSFMFLGLAWLSDLSAGQSRCPTHVSPHSRTSHHTYQSLVKVNHHQSPVTIFFGNFEINPRLFVRLCMRLVWVRSPNLKMPP